MTSSNTWCKLPDCCSYQEFSVAVELEGFCYVLGGKHSSRNQGRVSDVLRYESRTNTWSTDTVEPMPKAVSGATAVSFKGRIYVMGGGDRFETLNTVQKYNPDTNSWELVKPLEVSREGACSVSDGVNIYILGGMIGMLVPGTENDRNPGYGFECLNECEKYDSRNDSWSVISPMNEKRCYAAAAVLGHQIFVIGGGTNINGLKKQEPRVKCSIFLLMLGLRSHLFQYQGIMQVLHYLTTQSISLAVKMRIYWILLSATVNRQMNGKLCHRCQKEDLELLHAP